MTSVALLLMMFFIVQIFEQKKYSSPMMGMGSLVGIYTLGQQKKGALWRWCESCAHGRLSLRFAEQLGTGLAGLTGLHGLGSPGTARRRGFGLRKVK